MSDPVPTPEPNPAPAPEPTPQPEPTQNPEPSQSLIDTFREKAPEGAPTGWLDKSADDESLVKSIYAAQQMIGKKGDIPQDDAPPEAYQEFWGKLGANDINVELPELGDEFGDAKQQLGEYYGGIAEEVTNIAKEIGSDFKNIPDLLNKIVGKFVENDAKATLETQLESQKLAQEQVKAVAAKFGVSPEEFQRSNDEAIKRMGWDNETSIHEVVYQFNRMTTNGKGLEDAFMNNTAEGLDTQIKEISSSNDYLFDDGPKHKIAVEKMNTLLKKKFELENRG